MEKLYKISKINILFYLLSLAVLVYPARFVYADKLTLQQAVDTAIKNSPEVEIANLEKQRSDYQYKSKAAGMFPKVTNFTRYSSDNYSSDSTTKGWLISEEVIQPIWEGGKLYYTKELYRNLKDLSSLKAFDKELDITLDVKVAFFEVMKYSELLKVSGELKKVVTNHYENVNKMYTQGLVPKVDVLKTKAILDKTELDHIQILNEYYLAKNRLNYAMNIPIDSNFEIEYPERNLDVSLTLNEVMQISLARNPKVAMQDFDEKNAKAGIGIARSSLLPSIDAYGKFGNNINSSVGSTEKAAGITMNFDIWDWGKNYDELKASQVEYQQALKGREVVSNKMSLDVRNAYTDYDISLKRVTASKRFFNSISEEFKKQLVRFNNGQATNQDVLDSEALYAKAGFELQEAAAYCGLKKGALERSIGIKDFTEITSRPARFENDMDFIHYLENRAYLYFDCEQNKTTGLFGDTSGGGDASIASTGFGLAALCIGAENGGITKEEASARALLCLKSLSALNERKDGFFYHFLQINTGERAGTAEISSVDTAILLYGIIAASEYFEGDVKQVGYGIVNSVQWHKMLDKDGRFIMGWTPEDKYMKSKWNYYTDEILLMSIVALGSDEKVPDSVFYSFIRNKASYKDSQPFIVSWTGSLFTYQYANIWVDLRGGTDKDGVNWYENSKMATKSQIAYCRDNSSKYSSFKWDSWGISSCENEEGYTMSMGAAPCGEVRPEFDGTVSICGSVGSMIFTPFDSMRAAKYYYSRPELWGRYGLKNAFNDEKKWISNTYYGIDTGLMLLSIENFRNGFIWNLVAKSPVIKKGLERAGLKKK